MAISIGIRIWLRAIAINTGMWFVFLLWITGASAFIFGFFALFFGIVLTAPLLLVVIPLVKLSCRLPYSLLSRMSWLIICLVVLLWFYLVAINGLFFGEWGQPGDEERLIIVAACFSLLVAIIMTRSSLEQLHVDLKEPMPKKRIYSVSPVNKKL